MLDPSIIWTKDNWQQLSNGYWYNMPDVVDKSVKGAHAKTARNANAVYDLRNLDKARQARAQAEKDAKAANSMSIQDKLRAWRKKREEERIRAEEQKKKEEEKKQKDSHVSYDPSLADAKDRNDYDDDFGLDDYDEYDD